MTGHVARLKEHSSAFKNYQVNLQYRDPYERKGVSGRMILEWIPKELLSTEGTGL